MVVATGTGFIVDISVELDSVTGKVEKTATWPGRTPVLCFADPSLCREPLIVRIVTLILFNNMR